MTSNSNQRVSTTAAAALALGFLLAGTTVQAGEVKGPVIMPLTYKPRTSAGVAQGAGPTWSSMSVDSSENTRVRGIGEKGRERRGGGRMKG